ncbi:MAG: hypothetical protein HYY16_14015 [Planctomycetes bacterium]|nr:hypothetical protein [Planctomycetota bacterium]
MKRLAGILLVAAAVVGLAACVGPLGPVRGAPVDVDGAIGVRDEGPVDVDGAIANGATPADGSDVPEC